MTAPAAIDVLGIGNAIVDVLAEVEPSKVEEHGLAWGTMNLVDAEQSAKLHADVGGIEESGGSCANTIVAAASFGAVGAYIGKVRDDRLGDVFSTELRNTGVRFDTPPLTDGPATGLCVVMVDPGGHRTMCTYLGACNELGPEDIDTDLVSGAAITYMEGYLWDPPRAKEAFRKAMAAATAAGRKTSLTLSDPFCVERHRAEFRSLVAGDIDILFANEDEIRALYEVDTIEEALRRVQGRCSIVAVTRSERGSVVATDGERHEVPAVPIERVVDTTGAGDAYAAGFLYGLTHDHDLTTCGRLGSLAAAEIISHLGPRPRVDLAKLAAESVLS